jgi:Helix-turn-helix of DDE superfamily endonuclease
VSASDLVARRRSNEGYRKVDLNERVLIFLTRIKRKRSFKELGYLYGCGKASAQRYYKEIVELFAKQMVPRLVFPRSPEELLEMAHPLTKERFSDLLGVLDATNWEQLKSENFLLNRLTYSAYKHFVAFQVLFGKSLSYVSTFS